MNVLLIIHKDITSNKELLDDRIKSLGDSYFVFDNMAFVETDYNVQEAYDRVSRSEFEHAFILIINIQNQLGGYWGRMPSDLWDWLLIRGIHP